MTYSGTTERMLLPYPIGGDLLDEKSNGELFEKIDGLSMAFSHGYANSVFCVGDVEFARSEDGYGWDMSISPPGNRVFSIAGFVQGNFLYSMERISIPQRIMDASIYYLYLSCLEGSAGNHGDFRLELYGERLPDDSAELFVCMVTTIGEDGEPGEPRVVEVSGGGFSLSQAIGHYNESSNPHGETVVQRNVSVGREVSVGSLDCLVDGVKLGSFITNSDGETVVSLGEDFSRFEANVFAFPEDTSISAVEASCVDGAITFKYPRIAGIRVNYKISFRCV